MTNQEIADHLLWPCWRGMPDGYKMRYARNIWQQFEDNIRSAAYTSSVPKFFDTLCRKLAIDIGVKDIQLTAGILASGEDRQILRALREQTTALVLMVRLKNLERTEEFKRIEREAKANS